MDARALASAIRAIIADAPHDAVLSIRVEGSLTDAHWRVLSASTRALPCARHDERRDQTGRRIRSSRAIHCAVGWQHLDGAIGLVLGVKLYGTTTGFPSHAARRRNCSGVGFGSTSNLTGIPDASSVSVIPNLA